MQFMLILQAFTVLKKMNICTIVKIHLKYEVIDGSVVNGLRQPKFFSFVFGKPPGYKVFCTPETKDYNII